MFALSSASRACKRKLRAPQLEMKAAARAFSVFGCTGAMISYSAQEKYPTGTSDERLVVITTSYPLLKDKKLKISVLLAIYYINHFAFVEEKYFNKIWDQITYFRYSGKKRSGKQKQQMKTQAGTWKSFSFSVFIHVSYIKICEIVK